MFCWTHLFFVTILIGHNSVLCQNSGVLTGSRCNREPPGSTNGKTPGDNGYKIEILGNPSKYVPGESYTVSLHGWRTPVSVQKFIGFFLAVEPSVHGSEIVNKESGTLQLLGDAWTKFSDKCQNAVVHTSLGHKPEIQVMWTAPRLGSGCVKFKATIMESREIWYMDDGFLTIELCEEEQVNPDAQPEVLDECCACDEAKYEVTFQGLWSRHTHPKDFPKDHFRAHYSDIIGASHSPEYVMWEYGGYATEGLKQVAETGTTRALEAEMKDESDSIRTIIKARGLWFPNLNGSTFAVFRVDRRNHLMSLVTMMGPSPDWIVGVSRMELCLRNCSWVTQKTMNLYPWDAGTDSGTTYLASDLPTMPQDKIRRITNIFPNNEGSPFHDPSGQPMKPVARLTLTRQRLYEKDCDAGDLEIIDDITPTPIIDDTRMECSVTEWGHYSSCSTTCGKGMKFRSRSFTIPMKAKMAECTTSLMEKTACFLRNCAWDNSGEETYSIKADGEYCATSEWEPWSECSVSCGKGMRSRSRHYLDKRGRKTCHKTMMERQPCMAEVQHCDQFDPQCAVTPWSEWSPCMVTCGKGFKVRTRIYTNPQALAICKLELMQKEPCMAKKADCNFDIDEAMAICSQPRDEGLCRGHFPRWYFDTTRRSCHQFSWGGCRGNQNNFQKYEDCNRVCDVMKGGDMINRINPNPVILTYAMRDSSVHVDTQHGLVCVPIDSPIVTSHGVSIQPSVPMNKGPMPIDCMVTEWSAWSACSTTCGKGRKHRHRTIKVSPQHGGKSCPNKLSQGKKCSNRKSCN